MFVGVAQTLSVAIDLKPSPASFCTMASNGATSSAAQPAAGSENLLICSDEFTQELKERKEKEKLRFKSLWGYDLKLALVVDIRVFF